MHAALQIIDVVRECQLFSFEIVHVQKGHFDLHLVLLFVRVEYSFLQRLLAAGQMLRERQQAAVKVKAVEDRNFFAAVHQVQPDAFCEICLLAEVFQNPLLVHFERGEDLRVRREDDLGAGALRGAGFLDLGGRHAALVFLFIQSPIALHLYAHPLRERVHHRDADAVQTAGNLVAAAAEFATGVQSREYGLQRGLFGLRMDVHRDAAAVIGHGDFVLRQKLHGDVPGVAGHRLVYRIVGDLPDQVMQAIGSGGADIHARALADRVQALQDHDVLGAVRRGLLGLLNFLISL